MTFENFTPVREYDAPDITGQVNHWSYGAETVLEACVITQTTVKGVPVMVISPNTPRLTKAAHKRAGQAMVDMLTAADSDKFDAAWLTALEGIGGCTALSELYTHRYGTVTLGPYRCNGGPADVKYTTSNSGGSLPASRLVVL